MRKKIWLTLMASLVVGCSAKRPPAPPAAPSGPAPPTGEIRVTLAWSEPVDLDLYVTDPQHESVYFANATSGSSGKLERDVVCSGIAKGKRNGTILAESIRWERPPHGRYRVGVDFMDGCESAAKEVEFRVVIDAGGHREETVGKIEKGRFEPVVVEFDVPDEPEDSRAAH